MNSRLLVCAGLIGALVGSLGLSACGKQGALERPGPLLERRSQNRAQRDAAARGAGEASLNSSGTSQTNGDYSQPSDGAKDPALTPQRSNPPPVMNNPFGGRTGGTMPDPYADPNRAPR